MHWPNCGHPRNRGDLLCHQCEIDDMAAIQQVLHPSGATSTDTHVAVLNKALHVPLTGMPTLRELQSEYVERRSHPDNLIFTLQYCRGLLPPDVHPMHTQGLDTIEELIRTHYGDQLTA